MRAKTLLLLACAAPLTAFAQTAQRGTIDFELEELKTDTLFIGTYLASDIAHRNPRVDTIAPGWRTLELHADGTLTTEVHRLADTRFQPDTASEGY